MSTKGKSISSQTLREIRSATFDVDDGSCEGHVGSCPVESCRSLLSTETAEDTFDQQREPKQTWVNRETQTSCAEADDVHTKQAQPSSEAPGDLEPDVTREVDLRTGNAEADEKQSEGDILEGTEEIHCGSKVHTPEDKEEEQATKESEPDELSGRPGSVISSPPVEAVTDDEMSEAPNKEAVGDQDDQNTDDNDYDVGIASEKSQQVDEWVTQKDDTTKNASVENPLHEEEDSISIHTKHFIRNKMDHGVQKREGKSVSCRKVSEGFCSHPAGVVVL